MPKRSGVLDFEHEVQGMRLQRAERRKLMQKVYRLEERA
jgi:hypothetical protein